MYLVSIDTKGYQQPHDNCTLLLLSVQILLVTWPSMFACAACLPLVATSLTPWPRPPWVSCRCSGAWTRSWHSVSTSPPSTGSSPTPSTLHTQTLTARLPAGFVLIIIIRYSCHVVVDTLLYRCWQDTYQAKSHIVYTCKSTVLLMQFMESIKMKQKIK